MQREGANAWFKPEVVTVDMGLYGERLGSAFSVSNAPSLVSRTRGGFQLAATELRNDASSFQMSTQFPVEDAYLVTLHLADLHRHDQWLNGQLVRAHSRQRGDVCFSDLRQRPVTRVTGPFHLLVFYVSCGALAELQILDRPQRLGELLCNAGMSVKDPVIDGLGQSLVPSLDLGAAINQLYIDHVLLALRCHLAFKYGGTRSSRAAHQGGLATWQRTRALDLIRTHLSDGIELNTLSDACNLSPSAFLRAFRRTMGSPPHQWLMARRVEKAQYLIRAGELPLSQVALSAGFSDQSHLTRIFSRQMGISPGAWRRAQTAAGASPAVVV